jgi:hypothetical protein
MAEIKFDGGVSAQELLTAIKGLGFTPATHPNLLKDMIRSFKEVSARDNISLEDQISVLFSFDEDGLTGLAITRKG